uniref:molybdenum cofactor guanylyltransferase n=1 Tax=Ningiella ruwaisensis TaxID=2364274 RepID=UPI0010A0266D|nr:molybdenum cofactor guanylyltransferase [Ningiella ruwaisensis]
MQTLGVVLAGGRSSRMGQDKALLEINELSLLARAIKILSGTSVDEVVVSRNDGHRGHIADLIQNKGPLSGIHAVANRFVQHHLLILPVDVPLIEIEALEFMLTVGRKQNLNVSIAGHNLPLYLRNTPTTRIALDYTLRCDSCYSVGQFCQHFPMQRIQCQNSISLLNTNTPADWQMAKEFLVNNSTLISGEFAHGAC